MKSYVFKYGYGPIPFRMQGSKKKLVYSFNLRLRAASDLHVDPIMIAAALDTFKGDLYNINVPKTEMYRHDLHDEVEKRLLQLIKTNGRSYFPGKKKIEFYLETYVPVLPIKEPLKTVKTEWKTLKLTKED